MLPKVHKIVNFGKLTNIDLLPNLIQIQKKSFAWFLQADIPPNKRKAEGLEQVFQETFPIESPNEDIVLEYVDYELGTPKRDVVECKERGLTYGVPLKATIRLINKQTGEVREQSVFLGDMPMMTDSGTFVINGAERVVVSQVHRSPGIFFFNDTSKGIISCRVIPYRGSWLEFEMDNKGLMVSRIDRKKKFPVTLLIKALGFNTAEDVIRAVYKVKRYQISGSNARELKKIIGKRTAAEIINKETDEVILEAGGKINEDNIDLIREMQVKQVYLVEFENDKDESTLFNCLEKDGAEDAEDALLKLHAIMRPGEPSNLEYANNELDRLFFNPKTYDLGIVGRYKINNKFTFYDKDNFEGVEDRTLRREDIVMTVKYFLNLVAENYDYIFDDIDHLGNRRVRSVGELLMNQMKVGFSRTERVIKERMTVQDIDVITPQALISIKPITAVINEFFGTSQLSQFMDQTNPLSELTHKRRLNALGPGGLSRERAGFEVRDVHYSHYGRMCPIETPEGPNIGLNISMSTFARVNDYGFLETPYKKVTSGKVAQNFEYLTADIEEHFNVAQSSEPLKKDGSFANKLVSCRHRSNYPLKKPGEVHYMDVAPLQIISVSTSLIPFLEHDDANRALMGSNMQRQAVPLLTHSAPFVGTGMEAKTAYDSKVCLVSNTPGHVTRVDASHIEIYNSKTKETDVYKLTKFKRSNQGTCVNQKPLVTCYNAFFDGTVKVTKEAITLESEDGRVQEYPLVFEEVKFQVLVKDKAKVTEGELLAGQLVTSEKLDKDGRVAERGTVLADGPSTELGRLALGKNVLVSFMPWEGYNFEDAILISERVVRDDVFTSIHIEEYEIGARETKLGREIITRDIPNLSDKAFRDLDEDGVIRIGAEVRAGEILVGMVTPKGETDLTPEYKLLHSIFGEKAKEVRDSSLRMPNGDEGIVIDVRHFSRENGDELPPGVEEMVKVYVATKRKLKVGDKMAGRHGNKGVIARIMAQEDMPFMEDGTPVDLVLNPLGVPSRMNLGQILETQLGFAGAKLGIHFETPVFDGAKEEDIQHYINEAGLPSDGKFRLRDGRSGEFFENSVFCGYIYMIKLAHMVDDKIHARSTGPYSLVTQQPLGGKAQFGGQRLGEMEVWALEAYGASYTLQELLTVKSDDMLGRARIYEAIVKGIHSIKAGIPESFNVLVQELRGLALDISIFDSFGNDVNITDYDDDYGRAKRKIKIDSVENV